MRWQPTGDTAFLSPGKCKSGVALRFPPHSRTVSSLRQRDGHFGGGFAALGLAALLSATLSFAGTVYHVDSIDGSDSNPGTSAQSAWKSLAKVNSRVFAPGDKILFRSGSRYSGALKPQGSGTPEHPIVIDRYSEGSLPRIDGEGAVRATVLLHNVECWEVRNLEITNTGDQPMPKRRGVHILNEKLETARHLVLDGLYVHDVNGSIPKSRKAGVAILAEVDRDARLRFDGLTIENCHVKDCERDAIRVWGIFDRDEWFPSLNVVIRNNLIEGVGGDGIVPSGCDGALVERNIMRNCTRLGEAAGAAAGIWPWSCDNTVIQFNEVSDHKAAVDGQGFDSDYNCSNTVIQYNYSHDNEGGFLLVCCPGTGKQPHLSDSARMNKGSVIRYNVSINDGFRTAESYKGCFSPAFHITGPVKNSRICNNVIIVPEKPDPGMDRSLVSMDNWGGQWPVDTLFSNNVFSVAGSADFEFGKDQGTVFNNNRYFGKFANMPDDEGAVVSGSEFGWNALPDGSGFNVLKEFLRGKGIPAKPNLLIILADDLGYADLGIQGCTQFETPNIDSIASSGVRFTEGYVCNSVCAPSRAGLLTGRIGIGFESNLPHNTDHGLRVGEKTIADHLKTAGYKTFCIGKWHLGYLPQFHPNARGFDEFHGLIGGSRSYFALKNPGPYNALQRNGVIEEEPEGSYMTDRLTDSAVEYIESHVKQDPKQPFFMYLSYTAPHAPLDAKPGMAEKFSQIKNPNRRKYAAMVQSLDEGVGQVLETLEKTGIRENTLVVFLSDNGGPETKNFSDNGPLKGVKGSVWEGGMRVPFMMQWPGKIPSGQVLDGQVISLDLLPTFAKVAGVKGLVKTNGMDILPYLSGGGKVLPERGFFWRRDMKKDCAFRAGKYKYVENRHIDRRWLFNLAEDIGEKDNLLKQHPEIADDMQKKYVEWESTVPDPDFASGWKPKKKGKTNGH
ncbi:MAG: sulfatase-like hydrolase/transferase [Verrucomicrobiota bacterium]